MKNKKVVLGIGGSSGSIYAKLLMEKLHEMESVTVGVVMTDNAIINWEIEVGPFSTEQFPNFTFYDKQDFNAPFASGSAQYGTMISCPCSVGLMARMAHGISNDLITRAADVILKERRKLIVVPREAPYSLIHINNMKALTEAGAIICPATPSFYYQPKTVEEVAMTVVHRVLDLAGLESGGKQWGE